MARASDGHPPVSAYRAEMDIFVRQCGLMLLVPPSRVNMGLIVKVAEQTVWGTVLEPVDGQLPGADQFTLKTTSYRLQRIIFVRGDFVDRGDSTKCSWRTDKTSRMSIAELAVHRHPLSFDDPGEAFQRIAVIPIAAHANMNNRN